MFAQNFEIFLNFLKISLKRFKIWLNCFKFSYIFKTFYKFVLICFNFFKNFLY